MYAGSGGHLRLPSEAFHTSPLPRSSPASRGPFLSLARVVSWQKSQASGCQSRTYDAADCYAWQTRGRHCGTVLRGPADDPMEDGSDDDISRGSSGMQAPGGGEVIHLVTKNHKTKPLASRSHSNRLVRTPIHRPHAVRSYRIGSGLVFREQRDF